MDENVFKTAFYQSAQNRGEDHSSSVILNKHIFKALLQHVSEDLIKSLIVDLELGPVLPYGAELGTWLEAVRKILRMNQTDFGVLVSATQSEISNLEKNSERATFSRERLAGIIQKAQQAIQDSKKTKAA